MRIERDFDPADPGEIESYSFDFTNESAALADGTDTIVSAEWSIAVVSTETGSTADPDPSSRLLSTPAIDEAGRITSQFVTGLQPGNRYRLQAVCDTSLGERVSLYSHVFCKPLV